MPQRALYEQRPWLLASLAAAILYAFVRDSAMPEPFQLALKGASLALLAAYALLRHSGAEARAMAAVMAIAAVGSTAIDMFFEAGVALLVVAYGLGALFFLRHGREAASPSSKSFSQHTRSSSP